MKRFSTVAAVMLCGTAAFAQYTNRLEDGTNLVISSSWTNDAVWVGETTSSNTLSVIAGGEVLSSNVYVGVGSNAQDNAVYVTGGSLTVDQLLQIGPGTNNSVSVGSQGAVSVGDLVIHSNNTFNLNSGGLLAVATNFDASVNGFNWNDGGHLSVGGALTGMAAVSNSVYLYGKRGLTLDGGTWNTESGSLVVDDASELIVSNGGWVNVGEVQTNIPGAGMLVASTNGAQLVVGRGSVDIEDTLILGLSSNLTGTATIRDDGTLAVGDLQLTGGSLLELQSGGTFAISAGFDASTSGFSWNDGGHLSVGGALTGMAAVGSTNVLDGGRDLTLDGGSWDLAGNDLVVGWNGSDSTLTIRNGGEVSGADVFIGWGTNAANNEIEVIEDGGLISSGELWVGFSGDNNALSISSGGTVDVSGSAYLGHTGASQNSARVTGSNSVWDIDGDLWIGGVSNSVNNSLSVSDSGQVQVDGSLTLHSGNALSLDTEGMLSVGSAMTVYSNSTLSGTGTVGFGETNAVLSFRGDFIALSTGIVFNASSNYANLVSVVDGTFTAAGTNGLPYVNFQTLSLSNSTLNGSGRLDTFGTLAMTGGTIDPSGDGAGRLELPAGVSFDGTHYRAQVIINQWDELVFSGTNEVDLSTLSASVFVPYLPDTTNDIVILRAADLANQFSSTNLDVRPLLYDGELLVAGNEVQVVLVPVDSETISSTLSYAELESVRAGFHGMKNMVFTRTKQLRRNLVATAHALPNEVRLLISTNAPSGAMGPGDQNSIFDMHVWMQHYNGRGDYDGAGVSEAFALYNNGTTLGADKMIGEALTVGINYTYARSAARAENGDLLDTETYWIGAYGEWVGVDGLYFDAIAAYGFSRYDAERFAESYHGTASYDGSALAVAADLGQYYYYGQNLALSPYMGLHALAMRNESHTETEAAGSVVTVDDVEHSWVESVLGLKVRHRFDTAVGRFQATGYAEWSYDFVQNEIHSSLSAGGLPAVDTAHLSPDESAINVGFGYSWFSTDYMELGAGYNGRFSDGYEEHAGTLMLDIMF